MIRSDLLPLCGPLLSFFVLLQLLPPCRSLLPLSVRSALAFSVSLPFWGALPPNGLAAILLQAIRAALIAIPLAFAVESLRLAARTIDSARGAQFAEQAVPQLGQTSLLEQGAVFLSAVWILLSDFEVVVRLLYQPVRHELLCMEFLGQSLQLLSQAFYTGVLLAGPVFALALLLDVNGLLLAKLLPRFPLSFELLPWKLLLLLLALALRMQLLPESLLRLREEALRLVGGGYG